MADSTSTLMPMAPKMPPDMVTMDSAAGSVSGSSGAHASVSSRHS